MITVFGLLFAITLQPTASASPFGKGVFGADVPFGSDTSMSVSLGGNVNLGLTPNGGNLEAVSSHTVTITSTDVVGYRLYLYTPGSSNMTNGAENIPTSSNTSDASLAANTWGYNTTSSTSDFRGAQTTPQIIKTATGPYKNGDGTTITYKVITNITKGAGSYSVNVVYTAVSRS